METLPYEMRLMTSQEFHALAPVTRNLLVHAQAEIRKGKIEPPVEVGE